MFCNINFYIILVYVMTQEMCVLPDIEEIADKKTNGSPSSSKFSLSMLTIFLFIILFLIV